MWTFFIERNRFTILLMLSLICFGIYSVSVIPRESAPDITIQVGIVTTAFPGATALEVESQVTNEIEQVLSGSLSDVRRITSTSRDNVSMVIVEFNDRIDVDKAIRELTREVDRSRSRLPSDAEDPVVSEINFVDQPIVVFSVASSDLSSLEQTTLSEMVKKDIESLEGVARAEISGIRDREVSILVDRSALARFDLTLNEIISGLRANNISFPIGSINNQGTLYNVAFEGAITSTDDIISTPIAVRGGQPVFVRDVATVLDTVAETNSLSRLSIEALPAETAFTVNVFKRSTEDITRVAARVNEKLESLSEDGELLASYGVYIVQDAGKEIGTDLSGLVKTGLTTVTLVIIVLMIAIGWREGLVAGLAIPLSFVVGFIGLYLSGNTINFLSLFALVLGVGILVDSGIVMVEGINKRFKESLTVDKLAVAREAVQQFSAPLTAGTLTTVAMFSGLFIVGGVTGQFIASIPFTLIFVLLASLLVALGFLPLISAWVLKRRSTTLIEQKQTAYAHIIESWYEKKLRSFLRNKKHKVIFGIAITIGFISALALPATGLIKVVFFGQSDMPFIFVDIELPEGSPLPLTDIVVRQVEETLYQYPEFIDGFSTTVGGGNQFANFGGVGPGANQKLATILINLRENRPDTSTNFLPILRAALPDLPGVNITVSEPSAGPPVSAPITVKVTGEDLTEMFLAVDMVSNLVREIEGTVNITNSNSSNTTELVYRYNRDFGARFSVSPLLVSESLRTAVSGSEATSITAFDTRIPVVVRLQLEDGIVTDIDTVRQTQPETILGLTVPNALGNQISVGAVGEFGAREELTEISRENQKRVMTVSTDLEPTANLFEIRQQISSELQNLNLPNGITVAIGGENEESDQAFIELFLALIVGIVLMIAVLVLQFNSFRYTFYVLSIIPFSLIGIMYGLAITQNSLSFPSIMGFIALTGIVVNNSILLIDQMNYLRRQNPSLAIDEVVVRSSTTRLRPIILTTVTTVIGMIPLLTSDPIWVPLAFAVIFGLSFSVVITLILIPMIYNKWPGKLVT